MIEKIKIQNFKSIKDVELKLGKVNLLIGPNNSGKSNLLKALEFFGKCFHGKYDKAVDKKNIFAGEKDNQSSTIDLDFDNKSKCFYRVNNTLLNAEDLRYNALPMVDYEFMVYIESGEISKALPERFSNVNLSRMFYYLAFLDIPLHLNINNIPGGYSRLIDNTFKYSEGRIDSDWDGITIVKNELGNYYDIKVPNMPPRIVKEDFLNVFDNLKIYKPDLNDFSHLVKAGEGNRYFIDSTGSSLIPYLDKLRGSHEKIFNEIQNQLNQCISDFDEIVIDFDESKPDSKDKKLGLRDIRGNVFWSDELSEGTLYFLALLAIIHQPNPPKLLLLEEPESNIHPRRISDVINYIFKLAEEKDIQVIITSHSPLVVDKFRKMPESVHIFNMDEGETKVRNLNDVQIEHNEEAKKNNIEPTKFTDDLGENWILGLLGGVPDVNY